MNRRSSARPVVDYRCACIFTYLMFSGSCQQNQMYNAVLPVLNSWLGYRMSKHEFRLLLDNSVNEGWVVRLSEQCYDFNPEHLKTLPAGLAEQWIRVLDHSRDKFEEHLRSDFGEKTESWWKGFKKDLDELGRIVSGGAL